MHTLYFTRHGETVWNVENKICGMTDSPLTERGRQQARKLGEAVKASGVHITVSPFIIPGRHTERRSHLNLHIQNFTLDNLTIFCHFLLLPPELFYYDLPAFSQNILIL